MSDSNFVTLDATIGHDIYILKSSLFGSLDTLSSFELLALSLVSVTWIRLEQLVVKAVQLWAVQSLELRSQVLAHEV